MAGFASTDDRDLACLMALAQAGDREAYAQVLRRGTEILYGLRAEGDPCETIDRSLVEACLRTIHAARHTFDPKRSFLRWIAAIARHHGLSPS